MLTAWPTDRLGRPKLRRLSWAVFSIAVLPRAVQAAVRSAKKLSANLFRLPTGRPAGLPLVSHLPSGARFTVLSSSRAAQSSIQAATASSSCRYSAVACVTKSGGARPCSSQSAQPRASRPECRAVQISGRPKRLLPLLREAWRAATTTGSDGFH